MSEAGMILDEKIVGVWFLATMETQDWMASVREIEPDTKYELVWRFRYYNDDKVFDSEDRKSWYQGTVSGTRSYVIAAIRKTAEMIATISPYPLYEVLNDKGIDDFMRRFQDMPFVTVRIEHD